LPECISSALILHMSELQRTNYTQPTSPRGSQGRRQLAKVLRDSSGTVSPEQAATALGISSVKAAKQLARWVEQGWITRIRRGLYMPVPLESTGSDTAIDDAWVVAERVFAPCYIGGISAAEHWGMTEQVFRTIMVMTTRTPRDRSPTVRGVRFQLRSVKKESLFGLKPIWRGRVRVNVSDPSRTVIDLLVDPALGGGLRSALDILRAYLASKEFRNIQQLLSYADRLGNGAVFKRLGFLLERFAPQEADAIAFCRERLTQGNAMLDPALPSKRLASAWRLWIPRLDSLA
jgi:predicted transcriptional regulator of viral defense system